MHGCDKVFGVRDVVLECAQGSRWWKEVAQDVLRMSILRNAPKQLRKKLLKPEKIVLKGQLCGRPQLLWKKPM